MVSLAILGLAGSSDGRAAGQARVAIVDQWMASRPSTPPLRTVSELERLGFPEGRDIAYEWWNPGGDVDRLPSLVERVLASRPDVILAFGEISAMAASRATRSIPIVAWMSDPVAAGLATAALRPTRNVTGFVDDGDARLLKGLEILKAFLPERSPFGILVPRGDDHAARFAANAAAVASKAGIRVTVERFGTRGEIEAGLARLRAGGVRAAIAWPAPDLMTTQEVIQAGLRQRVALVAEGRGARYGMLMTFSPEIPAKRLADQVHRVLRGVPVGGIPFERSERFVLHLNRKTATELGIPIPPDIYLRADEVYDDWARE